MCPTKLSDDDQALEFQECDEGCPGYVFECNKEDLFNREGICVSDEERKDIEQGKTGLSALFSFIHARYFVPFVNATSCCLRNECIPLPI